MLASVGNRGQLKGNAYHAEVSVHVVLADRVERFVAFQTDRLAEFPEKGIHLFEGVSAAREIVAGAAGVPPFGCTAPSFGRNRNSGADPARAAIGRLHRR